MVKKKRWFLLNKLTPAENKVANLIRRGLSNRDIGLVLNITEGTVKLHVHSILKKLELNNRVELAVFVSENAEP